MPPPAEFDRTPTGATLIGSNGPGLFASLPGPGGSSAHSGRGIDPGQCPTSQLSSADVSVRSHQTSSTTDGETKGPTVVKDITFWGGLCLLICNTTGPGAVTLPLVAQSAGWLPTLIGFALVGLLSYLSSLFICEAMTEVPGNNQFQENVEFSNLVLCFFGRRYQILVQVICFLAMQTTNIASIAICAQLFDNLLIRLFHRTCGIQVYPSAAFICVTEQLPSASPFSGVMIMSTGALVALIMIVPLCLLNLSENIWLQIGSCILILLIFLQWTVTFFQHGLEPTRVPAIGSDMSQTFGSILFNYAFVTAVPSFANAKKPNVSAHKTVGSSVTTMTVLYLLVSILGGMAFEIPDNSTMIQAISASPDVTTLSQIAGYTFPIAALITSIPVNIIVLRYNLIQSGTCNKGWSNALAGGLPWLIALPGMTGSGLTNAVGWSSLFFVSAANFVIPFVLYIYSKKHKNKLRRLAAIDLEQEVRLSRELTMTSTVKKEALSTETRAAVWRRLAFWHKAKASEPLPMGKGLESKSEFNSPDEHEEKDVEGHGVGGVGAGEPAHGTSSFAQHSRTRAHGSQMEIMPAPFLGGNNYTIPGFGTRHPQNQQRTSSELELQRSRSGATSGDETIGGMRGVGLTDEENHLPQHFGELDTMWSLKAIPRWFPVSGMVVAWGSLILLLVGIIATIIVKIIRL